MSLEEQLLSDYGTVPQSIGMFLLKNNTNTLDNIRRGTKLQDPQLRDGLAILIQRRLVKFFVFEKTVKYHFDRSHLKNRLYFPLYLQYIKETYGHEHAGTFLRVLTNGILKCTHETDIIARLLHDNVLQPEATKASRQGQACDDADANSKIRRLGALYLVVNYSHLNTKIHERETARFVAKKYNTAAADVFKAVLRCDKVDKAGILRNLTSTKVLLLDSGVVINDRSNIDEYLRYLCSSNIMFKGADSTKEYFFNANPRLLKLYRINLMLSSSSYRRLFNMIASQGEIDDKTLTVTSLLSVNKVKRDVLALQKTGLLVQHCLGDYKHSSKIEHAWSVDLDYTSRLVSKHLEAEICERLKLVNECWDVNYFMDNAEGNEKVWMSDIVGLGTDHLILHL